MGQISGRSATAFGRGVSRHPPCVPSRAVRWPFGVAAPAAVDHPVVPGALLSAKRDRGALPFGPSLVAMS